MNCSSIQEDKHEQIIENNFIRGKMVYFYLKNVKLCFGLQECTKIVM